MLSSELLYALRSFFDMQSFTLTRLQPFPRSQRLYIALQEPCASTPSRGSAIGFVIFSQRSHLNQVVEIKAHEDPATLPDLLCYHSLGNHWCKPEASWNTLQKRLKAGNVRARLARLH